MVYFCRGIWFWKYFYGMWIIFLIINRNTFRWVCIVICIGLFILVINLGQIRSLGFWIVTDNLNYVNYELLVRLRRRSLEITRLSEKWNLGRALIGEFVIRQNPVPQTWSMIGASCLQGPHQLAVKSTRTGLSLLSTSCSKLRSLKTWTFSDAMMHPT